MKQQWIVKIKATVYKTVTCEDCSREEAENDPFDHAIDEQETGQVDYEVLSVEDGSKL